MAHDPNGPTAKLLYVHHELASCAGGLAIMISTKRLDVDRINELDARVQAAALAFKDFAAMMMELKRIKDENAAEGDAVGAGDNRGAPAPDGSVERRNNGPKRPRKTGGRNKLQGDT